MSDNKVAATSQQRGSGPEFVGVTWETFTQTLIAHQREVTDIFKKSADESAAKVEEAQRAVNLAANEWRAAMNDYRKDTITRAEFQQSTVSAKEKYDLLDKRLTVMEAKQSGAMESKTESRANIGSISSLAVGVAAIGGFLVASFIHPTTSSPAVTAPQSSQQWSVPPGYTLVPAQREPSTK